MIYADDTSYRYTRTKREGFYTYSELFRKRFGDEYECCSDGTVMSKTAKTVNFKKLIQVLKSKDESVFEQNNWMFDG